MSHHHGFFPLHVLHSTSHIRYDRDLRRRRLRWPLDRVQGLVSAKSACADEGKGRLSNMVSRLKHNQTAERQPSCTPTPTSSAGTNATNPILVMKNWSLCFAPLRATLFECLHDAAGAAGALGCTAAAPQDVRCILGLARLKRLPQ
jgi:hypothetical protein